MRQRTTTKRPNCVKMQKTRTKEGPEGRSGGPRSPFSHNQSMYLGLRQESTFRQQQAAAGCSASVCQMAETQNAQIPNHAADMMRLRCSVCTCQNFIQCVGWKAKQSRERCPPNDLLDLAQPRCCGIKYQRYIWDHLQTALPFDFKTKNYWILQLYYHSLFQQRRTQ